jgi:hypothetical protein
LIQLILNSL